MNGEHVRPLKHPRVRAVEDLVDRGHRDLVPDRHLHTVISDFQRRKPVMPLRYRHRLRYDNEPVCQSTAGSRPGDDEKAQHQSPDPSSEVHLKLLPRMSEGSVPWPGPTYWLTREFPRHYGERVTAAQHRQCSHPARFQKSAECQFGAVRVSGLTRRAGFLDGMPARLVTAIELSNRTLTSGIQNRPNFAGTDYSGFRVTGREFPDCETRIHALTCRQHRERRPSPQPSLQYP